MPDPKSANLKSNGGNGVNGAKARVQATTELSRDLKCFDITMIGVGAMIGAGIFVLTGIAAGTAGPALILSFALNAIVTIFTAMVYAELGSAIPEAGGGYLWVKEGLPGGQAFLSGWMSWFAHAVAGSLYALGFGAYFGLVLHTFGWSFFGLNDEVGQKVMAAAIAVAFTYINFRGASETGKAGNIVTLIKIAILGLFVVSGLFAIWRHPDFMNKFTPFAPTGLTGIFSAMGLTFIAFEGYEIIVQAGEEVIDPRRTIPKAIFLSLAIVIPIYVLVAFVALGAVTPSEPGQATWQWLGSNAELGLAEAAKQFMPLGTTLLLIGGIFSTMSALNATTFSSTRVSFAMGRDHNLPDSFAKIHPRTRTPWIALIASGGIIIAMAVAVPIEHVAAAADIMFLLLFLQVNVAAISIRRQYGDKLNYGYIVPFFPFVTVVGIVTKLGLALFMFNYSALAWYVAIGWIAGGWILWLTYAKRRDHLARSTPVVLAQTVSKEKKTDFRVLVPVANPRTAKMLMHAACNIARFRRGEIIILHVVSIPKQLPPRATRRLIEARRDVINSAMSVAEKQGVPASSLIRIAHQQPWKAILDTTDEYDIDFVIMGWHGHSTLRGSVIGKNIDHVIRRGNCDVLVLQESTGDKPIKRVLVPISNPHQGELMVGVVAMLANGPVEIDILHVHSFGASADPKTMEVLDQLNGIARIVTEDFGQSRIAVKTEVSTRPFAEIIKHAQNGYDLLVLGSSNERWFRRSAFGMNPQSIADRLECPVVLVSRKSGTIKYSVQQFFEFFRNAAAEADFATEQSRKDKQANGGKQPKAEPVAAKPDETDS